MSLDRVSPLIPLCVTLVCWLPPRSLLRATASVPHLPHDWQLRRAILRDQGKQEAEEGGGEEGGEKQQGGGTWRRNMKEEHEGGT